MYEEKSINQTLAIELPDGISLTIKREDLIHPHIPGNKWRKLKYNLQAATQANQHTLLTFGGAYSNHIAAVAAAGREFGFKTIGIIRGEELAGNYSNNATLQNAQHNGMQLHFISRSQYRLKNSPEFIKTLQQQFGDFYRIPEGGTNRLAVQGCEEILTENDKHNFDYICCSVGTGGTLAGIINSCTTSQQVIGFSALKDGFKENFLVAEVKQWLTENTINPKWLINSDYHFGGYAKTSPALFEFIRTFMQKTAIALDPVYTGKMLYGVFELIHQGYFPANCRILAIHTGGLQGNQSDLFKMQLQCNL